MAQRPWNPILEHIRSIAARHDSPACDAELLGQFVSQHDETAFESLLRRHGPMVLRVARRVLGNETDAEDVFQATFLLLARRAAAIRKRESVASWLHGVAHRLALSARGKRARRRDRERRAAAARPAESPPESAWSELEETLHEVLAQLPAKYRTPLVYCYLEGRTQEEVAQQLGKPLGTVRSWLARGRELLRKRLLRRGITLSAEGASVALLASVSATAEAVPVPLRIATLRTAHLFVMGENAMMLISPQVAALVRKGLTAMLVAKLKSGAACLLMATLLIAGSGWAAHRRFVAEPTEFPQTRADDAPPKQAASEKQPRTNAPNDPLPPEAVARLGTMRFRHEESFRWQFAVSPDGRTVATAAGPSLILWEMATGRPLRRYPLTHFLRCLAFAPDGKSVAVGGEEGIVYRIDLASGKHSQRFVGHQTGGNPHDGNKGVWGVGFTADGKKLISWGSDKTVRVWETHSGKELRQFGPQDFACKDWLVRGLSPEGKILVMSKKESPRTFRLWDLEAGKEIRQRTFPDIEGGGVAFSPDGKILAVAACSQIRPGRIVLWDVESDKELRASPSHTGSGYALAFSPDGKTLASYGFRQPIDTIRLWDVASMKELRATAGLEAVVYQLAFSRDGKTLLSRGSENHIRLWDVASGKEQISAEGASQAIRALAYSSNGKLVASASENKMWLWSAATGKIVRTLESPENNISAVAFSADGKLFVSASRDGMLRLWDVETGKERRSIRSEGRHIGQVALSPDGETVAVWDHFIPQAIFRWNTRTGLKRRDIDIAPGNPGTKPWLKTLIFSPDGKILYAISATHKSILRWDAATGKELSSLGKHLSSINGIALSPDGRSIAVVTGGGGTMTPKGIVTWDGVLYLWETATGQARLDVKDVGFATSIAFSPDDSLLALANVGNVRHIVGPTKVVVPGVENREQVRLVRVTDGKVIHRFTGHIGGIHCLSFSPDGRTLASGGSDSTVLLWDVTDRTVPKTKETPPFKAEKFASLWAGLRGTAAESFGCMNALISAANQTVPFLSVKLKPIATVDADRFAQLLKKLDSDQFREREEAMQELKKLGDAVEPALRKAIEAKPPLETRRRLQLLLDELSGDERLRTLRAIEVLERIGDKQARDLLQRLSQGATGAWLTEEARTTLRRLR